VISFASLILSETKEAIYAKGLQIGAALGLPVTTWAPGDPTRSDYYFIAEILETLEAVVGQLAKSSVLDESEGDWLIVKAEQDYGVTAVEATYATAACTLTNGGGGQYTIVAGDLTAKNTATGKTYRNVTGGSLVGVGATLSLDFVADEPGSGSNAAAGEIDALVTVLRAVTITNPAAAIGLDQESEDALRTRCREKLGSLSPNGPRDAYAYIAKSSEFTGSTEVTDARVYDDADTGDVEVYLRGASGAVSGDAVTAVLAAILEYAAPLCITPAVASATNVTVAVTYQLWLYSADSRSTSEIEDAVEAALLAMLATRPIGGDIITPGANGYVYLRLIEATIKGVSPYAFRVALTLPAADVELDPDEVAVLGTVTATITKVADP
jgi:phage-related baseplate assembly protein